MPLEFHRHHLPIVANGNLRTDRHLPRKRSAADILAIDIDGHNYRLAILFHLKFNSADARLQ